jgi:hypothetical protein
MKKGRPITMGRPLESRFSTAVRLSSAYSSAGQDSI